VTPIIVTDKRTTKKAGVSMGSLYNGVSLRSVELIDSDNFVNDNLSVDSLNFTYFNLCCLLEKETPLRRPERRWKNNIKITVREMGCKDGRWIELAQDRVRWRALVLAVLNLQGLLLER
jgi:hypothetical protein